MFMEKKKKEIDMNEESRQRERILRHEKLKYNMEILKNEIKEKIYTCKTFKKGNNNISSNQ